MAALRMDNSIVVVTHGPVELRWSCRCSVLLGSHLCPVQVQICNVPSLLLRHAESFVCGACESGELLGDRTALEVNGAVSGSQTA